MLGALGAALTLWVGGKASKRLLVVETGMALERRHPEAWGTLLGGELRLHPSQLAAAAAVYAHHENKVMGVESDASGEVPGAPFISENVAAYLRGVGRLMEA